MGFLAKKRSGANWDAFFVKQRGSGRNAVRVIGTRSSVGGVACARSAACAVVYIKSFILELPCGVS